GRDPAAPARHAERWLDTIAATLGGRPPRHGRSKHLVALPVLGTGAGGHYFSAGEVLTRLVPILHEKARSLDLDLALVARDPDVFAAARAARGADPASWPDLAAGDPALELAELAGRGRLVLFLGAGASAGAGLPDWNGLLQQLARAAGVAPDSAG